MPAGTPGPIQQRNFSPRQKIKYFVINVFLLFHILAITCWPLPLLSIPSLTILAANLGPVPPVSDSSVIPRRVWQLGLAVVAIGLGDAKAPRKYTDARASPIVKRSKSSGRITQMRWLAKPGQGRAVSVA